MIWEIDPFHSLVEFSVQHLNVSIVKGRFTDVHGKINLDTQHPEESWVKAQIMTESIHTGVPQRDAHLRSSDFFEVAKYPTITFESTQVKRTDHFVCKLVGNLSLHGVNRPILMDVGYTGYSQDFLTEAWRAGFHAATAIDRRSFNITFSQNKAGIDLIGYEVHINITIEAIQVG